MRESLTHRAVAQRQSKDIRQTFRAADAPHGDNVRIVDFAQVSEAQEPEADESDPSERGQLADALYIRCEHVRDLFLSIKD